MLIQQTNGEDIALTAPTAGATRAWTEQIQLEGKDITAVLDTGCFACTFITLEGAIKYAVIVTPNNDLNSAPKMTLGNGTHLRSTSSPQQT